MEATVVLLQRTILIVEDERVSRLALTALMSASGYETEAAGSAEEALDVVRAAESHMTDHPARGCGTVTLPELRRAGVGVCLGTVLARAEQAGLDLAADGADLPRRRRQHADRLHRRRGRATGVVFAHPSR